MQAIEKLLLDISVIIENVTLAPYFPSCTEAQWQALINTFTLTSDTSWQLLASNTIRSSSYLFVIGSDLVLYLAVPVLLIHFGALYSSNNASSLLLKSASLSQKFVLTSFSFLCIHMMTCAQTEPLLFGGLYQIDLFSTLIKFFMLIIWLSLNKFVDSLTISKSHGIAEFPILSHLVLCFSFIMISACDFALLLVSLEGFSLILYIMASIGRLHGGITASIKYFAFGTAGSILIFWGAIHYYEVTSSLNYKVLAYFFNSLEELPKFSIMLTKMEWASSAIFVGLLIKLGAAPTHQWVPDVYSGSSMFVTAFYSVFVKFILYVLFLRLSFQWISASEVEYIAALSLTVGCFGALRQVEIKRFLAYGSITHTGFLLMGDFSSSIIYLASYILASLILFSVLLNLRLNRAEFVYLSDLRYIGSSGTQWDRLLVALSLASMAGLPPFAGFYGKMLVWSSLIEDIYLFNDASSYFLFVLNLAVSLVVIFYYVRLIIMIYLGDENSNNTVLSYKFEMAQSYTASVRQAFKIQLSQKIAVFFLIFWTFIMPWGLTIAIVSAELIGL